MSRQGSPQGRGGGFLPIYMTVTFQWMYNLAILVALLSKNYIPIIVDTFFRYKGVR